MRIAPSPTRFRSSADMLYVMSNKNDKIKAHLFKKIPLSDVLGLYLLYQKKFNFNISIENF